MSPLTPSSVDAHGTSAEWCRVVCSNVFETADAEARGVSNCPLCAVGHAANARRIWKFAEMDADHVTAWSKGGSTDLSNCQMLCRTHNRAKGNR